MSVELFDWDIQESLDTPEARQAYFQAALEEYPDDPAFIQSVLGDIAKSYGVSKLAKEIGLSREGLYKSLNEDGNPSFATVFKVAKALGLDLNFGTPKVEPALEGTGIAQAVLSQQVAPEDQFDYFNVKHSPTGKTVLNSLASSLWGDSSSVKLGESDFVKKANVVTCHFHNKGVIAHKNAKHRALKLLFSNNTKDELINMLVDLAIESNKIPQTRSSATYVSTETYKRFDEKEIPNAFNFWEIPHAIK